MGEPKYITLQEAAKIYGCSVTYLLILLNAGRVPHSIRLSSGDWLIPYDEFMYSIGRSYR